MAMGVIKLAVDAFLQVLSWPHVAPEPRLPGLPPPVTEHAAYGGQEAALDLLRFPLENAGAKSTGSLARGPRTRDSGLGATQQWSASGSRCVKAPKLVGLSCSTQGRCPGNGPLWEAARTSNRCQHHRRDAAWAGVRCEGGGLPVTIHLAE